MLRQANVQHMIWFCRNSNIDYINLHSSDILEHSLRILSRVCHLKWHLGHFTSRIFTIGNQLT